MRVFGRKLDLSRHGFARIWLLTIFGTLGCVAAALYLDSFNFVLLDEAARNRAILFDITVPMLIAAPLFFFFGCKIRELTIAHHQLSVVASTDSLTAVLNRGAFRMLVEAYLTSVEKEQCSGALLVVDADEFKFINDTFGHDRGDEALRIIASSIKASLRGSDLVGRMGGEEFAVFLPSCPPNRAEVVAERIRHGVAAAAFAPMGRLQPLSVSVGGASFSAPVGFDDLYRLADQRLYAAKQDGRNRVAFAPPHALGVLPEGAAIH